MKLINVKSDSFADYNEEYNKKDPNFKVGDHVGFQSMKIFLLKYMFLIGVKKFGCKKKSKILYLGLL